MMARATVSRAHDAAGDDDLAAGVAGKDGGNVEVVGDLGAPGILTKRAFVAEQTVLHAADSRADHERRPGRAVPV